MPYMGFEGCFAYGEEFLKVVRTTLYLYVAYGINDNKGFQEIVQNYSRCGSICMNRELPSQDEIWRDLIN